MKGTRKPPEEQTEGKAKLQEFCLQQLQNTESGACDVVRAHGLCPKAGLEALSSPSTALGTVGCFCSQGGAGAAQGQQGWRDITPMGDTVPSERGKPDRRRSQQTQGKRGVSPGWQKGKEELKRGQLEGKTE